MNLVYTDIARARQFAVDAHGDQKYGDRPYSYHLDAVADLVSIYGTEASVVAYLHDVLEDTDTLPESIDLRFGDNVGFWVRLVTDPWAKTRAERKTLANMKFREVRKGSYVALIVKAADRLANLRESVKGDGHKLEMYRREHTDFRLAAYRPGLCDELWAEMDRLLGWK